MGNKTIIIAEKGFPWAFIGLLCDTGAGSDHIYNEGK